MQNDLRILQQRYNEMIRTLPVEVGAVAVAFSKQRFREQAWAGDVQQPWPKRKASKKDRGRAILVKTGRLRRSIRVVRYGNLSVTIGTDVPYAEVHNEGFSGSVSVAAHKRKRFGKQKIDTGSLTKKGKARKKTVVTIIGEVDVAAHKRLVRMPRRRFMGASQYLNRQVARLVTMRVNGLFQ